MPKIYDNIGSSVLDGLRQWMKNARRADFCVGYFNLRGWGKVADSVEQLSGGGSDEPCRLLIGMSKTPRQLMREECRAVPSQEFTQGVVPKMIQGAIAEFSEQLQCGIPTAEDQRYLQTLETQIRDGKVRAKFHGRHPLHAKLYIVHREDDAAKLAAIVGSSNLTLAGLTKNGELNVDVLDQDAAQKLLDWFNERWEDDRSLDVHFELANSIKQSWVGGPIAPYLIYLKTAYELSRDAIDGLGEYPLPSIFDDKMMDFQAQAVSVAAKILSKQGGVIVGDVVGLGKTIVASAIAKTFQDDHGDSVLVICPPKLKKMWRDYMLDYNIAGDVFSSGNMRKLAEQRRYKLLIVDESHNFRNRESASYAHLRDYIIRNDSRVILLTATPYNKSFADIASQLRLFVAPDKDLGIRPDNYINRIGIAKFKSSHQVLVSSLAAFEKAEDSVDDWRELMRHYLVRRTRAYIKEHHAHKDDDGRHYLKFPGGGRYYFPDRRALNLKFNAGNDYAKLYSPEVVEQLGQLALPRYGLGAEKYIASNSSPTEEEERIINNLTRAGARLRGFARSGLFKRLESGGKTFLLSIRRHIVRNAVYWTALQANESIPVGQIFSAETDEAMADADDMLFSLGEEITGVENWKVAGFALYKKLKEDRRLKGKMGWINSRHFLPTLAADLEADIRRLLTIHELVPDWNPKTDGKLAALFNLVSDKHGDKKVLVFSQFKDTVEYLVDELKKLGVEKIAAAHGDTDGIAGLVGRFSPRSNGINPGHLNELRVVVATDVLSEGQNLQDANIVVNYDLPWAVIRLIQRAGRVDRIGQQAREILCYSAMPEDGVETIIDLRGRLLKRMNESTELVGSDEDFFGDKREQDKALRDLYAGRAGLDDEDGDDTDLLSRAHDIWLAATKDNPALAKQIQNLPNVVYGAKPASEDGNSGGVVAYIKDGGGSDILALVNREGEVISQSQSQILDEMKCAPDTPRNPAANNHHELVGCAAAYLRENAGAIGGQLGGPRSPRRLLYSRLKLIAQSTRTAPLLDAAAAKTVANIVEMLLARPLTDTAAARFRRLLTTGADNETVINSVLDFHAAGSLCVAEEERDKEPRIVCSMGLL